MGGPPDVLVLHNRLHGGVVGAVAPGAAAVVQKAGEERLFRALFAVHDGVRLDGDVSVELVEVVAAGGPVDLGLHVLPLNDSGGRLGRVQPEGVLGDVTAVGGDQADRAGLPPQES